MHSLSRQRVDIRSDCGDIHKAGLRTGLGKYGFECTIHYIVLWLQEYCSMLDVGRAVGSLRVEREVTVRSCD